MVAPVLTRTKDADLAAHPLLGEVFGALDQGSIRWCLLRAEHRLRVPGLDVAVLVAPDQKERAAAIAGRAGFVRVGPSLAGSSRHLVAHCSQADQWIWLEVATRLSFGPFPRLEPQDVEEVLSRAAKTGAATELTPDDAFWIVLLDCLLDKTTIERRDAERLYLLASAATPDGPLARQTSRIVPVGWNAERMIDCARRRDWTALEKVGADLRTRARAKRRFDSDPKRAIAEALEHATRPFAPQRGMTVALLAPDGAGKSSVAAGLINSFPLPVRLIYMGRAREGRHGRRGTVASGLARQWCRYLVARFHRFRGRLVLFDRYTYDALLPPKRRTPARVVRRWVFAHAVPAPDVVVLLDAPAELMFRRKGEHSEAFLEQRRGDYLDLRRRLPDMVVVDAAQDLDDVRRDVTRAIWARYRSRNNN
jgi:thymidylate kinase